MKKIYLMVIAVFLIIGSGCAMKQQDAAIISAAPESDYVKTFKDLSMGILYDFNFKLPNADEKWVNIWVERYNNGKKVTQPLVELSYGTSPNETEEGHLGFGIINPNSKHTMVFLYAPGVAGHPIPVEQPFTKNKPRTWDYSIGDEEVELKSGETKLLGVYRQSSDNSIRTYDMQDPEAIQQMIKDSSMVLLLKIKVEERSNADETS